MPYDKLALSRPLRTGSSASRHRRERIPMPRPREFRVFISAVSGELKSCRSEIARVLRRKELEVRDQERFQLVVAVRPFRQHFQIEIHLGRRPNHHVVHVARDQHGGWCGGGGEPHPWEQTIIPDEIPFSTGVGRAKRSVYPRCVISEAAGGILIHEGRGRQAGSWGTFSILRRFLAAAVGRASPHNTLSPKRKRGEEPDPALALGASNGE